MQEILDSVSFAGVTAFVTASGILIMGITLALKGITLGKRTVNKA